MGIESIKGKLFRKQNDILILLATWGTHSRNSVPMVFLGNAYSGYWFPKNLVESRGTIWGVGLGMDSSFEVQLGKFGYRVLGFEPDTNCIKRAKNEFANINSVIYQFGIWNKNGIFESFGSSISLVNIFDSKLGNKDSLEIRNIHDVAESIHLDLQKAPRILKMNIEGAEREILMALVVKPLNFEIVMFQAEFLTHLGFFKVIKKIHATIELRSILRGLSKNGFQLVHNCRNQLTLVSRNVLH